MHSFSFPPLTVQVASSTELYEPIYKLKQIVKIKEMIGIGENVTSTDL